MSRPDPKTAVLLMAHGSRRADANADLEELARRVRDRGGYAIVEVSYLELAEPSIPAGGRNCVAKGADRVLMLPYFLSAGRHVTEDLQRFQRELSAEFPRTPFELCPPLGLHPLMTQIALDRLSSSSPSDNDKRQRSIAYVESLLSMKKHKSMYLGTVTVESAVGYLNGFQGACFAAGLTSVLEQSRAVYKERGWHAGSHHPSHAMIQQGLPVEDIVDELIDIEIEAIRRASIPDQHITA